MRLPWKKTGENGHENAMRLLPTCGVIGNSSRLPTSPALRQMASAEDDPPSLPRAESSAASRAPLAQHLHPADLRGAVQLATEATCGATRLVEAVHAAAQAFLRPNSSGVRPRTDGLTGWIYRTVRRIARLSGQGTAWAFQELEHVLGPTPRPDTRTRQQLLSILNGVLGDHLDTSDSPLARSFSLRRRNGQQIDVDATGRAVSDVLVVFVHGLCLSDRAWIRTGDQPGHVAPLTDAVEGTAVFARYNTGRPTWANGRALSGHLESVATGPSGPSRIVLVTHSMGGLVARSAVQHARRAAADWPDLVTETVYLGTPHRGAPLERAGAWIETQLRRTPLTTPFAVLADRRSQGIQDLGHGTTTPDDVPPSPDRDETVSSPERAFYGAASLAPNPPTRDVVGDGLVPVSSALALPDPPRPATRRVFDGLGHLDLFRAPAVTEHLCRWLSASDQC